MSKNDFNSRLAQQQVAWRKKNLADQTQGFQNGVKRPWILPRNLWEDGLWPGIRGTSTHSLPAYLAHERIERHTGTHNLKSSWILCANLYFPFQQDLPMLAGFLKETVSPSIESVNAIELEYQEAPPLDPQTLLGEPEGGQRGSNQTSPDVAFLVTTTTGRGLILTENKLAEHSFYGCSGRKPEVENPDKSRCMDFRNLISDLPGRCWQLQWEQGPRKNRKYWDFIRFSELGNRVFTRCPAATAGYQLFRQQALAEGIANNDRYDLVVSCVAYDSRNDTLIGSLRSTGINDFSTGWAGLITGKAKFATFTHQQWVKWVRDHDSSRRWANWLDYVGERYGYL